MWEKTTILTVLATLSATAMVAWPSEVSAPPPAPSSRQGTRAREDTTPHRVALELAAPIAVPPERIAQVEALRAAARDPLRFAVDPATRALVEPALRSIGRGPDRADWAGGAVLDAYERVLDGRSELAIAAREPSRDERARGLGELRLGELVVALAVHRENPLRSIPSRQLRELVRGKLGDWRELGVTHAGLGRIKLFVPPPGPVADLYARAFVAGDRFGGADDSVPDDAARLRAVAGDENAIAVVSVAAALDADVRLLPIDGEVPSLAAARCGRYPFTSPIMLAYKDGNDARVRAFLLELRGAKAQRVLAGAICLD